MKALITGASSGIGRDIAKYLSSKGYECILVARDQKKLKELAKELDTKTYIKEKQSNSKERIVIDYMMKLKIWI